MATSRRTDRRTRTFRPRLPAAQVGTPAVRHRLVLSMIMVAVLALSGRLLWVQGLDASARAQEAIDARTTTRTIPALRGDITDRDGTVLASSVERFDLWVNQRQVSTYQKEDEKAVAAGDTGVKAAAADLAPVLGWTVEDTEKALTGDKGFKYLQKNVEPAVRNAVIALKIPGLGADRVADRLYPAGSVAGNVLGFVGADGAPLAGAELSYDDLLAGTNGKTTYERGAGGQIIPTATQSTTAAVDGSDLVLTLDRDLQWKAQEIIASAVDKWGATAGSIVILDAHTGEVLTLAEAPTYDPNSPEADSYLGNRTVSDVYEPGSTGKLFTLAAALEEGTVDMDSQYTVPYTMSFNGERIKDSHSHPTQKLTLAGVLKNSSNVGTVQISETLSDQTRYDYLKAFGLGEATGVGLPGESKGIVHDPSEWTGRTKYTTAFGQGYAVTALQMVSAISTFANDGVRVQPQIVKGVKEEDGSVRSLGEPTQTRVVSSETSQKILELMDNNVVDDGKTNGDVPGYAVAAKSGTAQVPGEDGGITYTASFIGTAPADDPDIVIGVTLFGLNSFISGTTAAAPAFSEIMAYTLQNQGIAPTGKPGRELENEW